MVSLIEAAYLAISFVVFVVAISVGGGVLSGLQTSQLTTAGATTVASNATGQGLVGITNLSAQSGVIGTVLAAVVVIGLLMGAFMMRK